VPHPFCLPKKKWPCTGTYQSSRVHLVQKANLVLSGWRKERNHQYVLHLEIMMAAKH